MPSFALKGALSDYGQLAARASAMVARGLPVRIEFHTFAGDVLVGDARKQAEANAARLSDQFPVEGVVVHVPPQSVPIVTRTDFDADQCRASIAMAHNIGAEAVVVHRYFGLVYGDAPPRIADRGEATCRFAEAVRKLAAFAGDMRLLVENIGHYSVMPRDGRSYMSGPLDHFFPWEIEHFRDFVAAEGLTTVEPFVDVAHATLSANLFNRRRACPKETRNDPRFAWIIDEDLDRTNRLHPFDFVNDAMPYLHVSDAVWLDEAECREPALAEATLTRSLVSEGLEIGKGRLPFAELPCRYAGSGTLVLEIDPAPGEDHVANGAQIRSLDALAAFYGTPCKAL